MSIKNNKGITLIALVITIIVLLILAGVTINMVLGEDGIIAQATDAEKTQTEAEEKQAIQIAIGEANTSEYLGVMSASELIDELGGAEADYANAQIRQIKNFGTEADPQYLPIPKGMAWAFGTIDEGAVVVDSYGNEYVWVPVEDTTKMFTKTVEEYETVYTAQLYDLNNDGWAGTEPSDVPTDGTLGDMQKEYNDMAKSVETYGGFYVGRYETGGFNSTRVVSKAGEDQESCAKVTWYDAYKDQKALHENSSSIVSGMIYGSQWDAIMDWMSGVDNPNSSSDKNYIFDSTGMGNYSGSPILTGSNSAYSVKNIYDLAGNYYEWTQEANGTYCRVHRSGVYLGNGSDTPASFRNSFIADSDYPDDIDFSSSRLQLYIK